MSIHVEENKGYSEDEITPSNPINQRKNTSAKPKEGTWVQLPDGGKWIFVPSN